MNTANIFIALLLIVWPFQVFAKKDQHPAFASRTAVWVGLDYTLCRMIGSDNIEARFNFVSPDSILPSMPEKWNRLFIDERIESLAPMLGRIVHVDIENVTELNRKTSPSQITLKAKVGKVIHDTHITHGDISNKVHSYKLANTNGIGFVFIVDRLVRTLEKPNDMSHAGAIHHIASSSQAAIYIVVFDVASREIVSINREVHSISTGGNFRNFWFGPIKDAANDLGRFRLRSPNKLINQQRR